MPTPPRVELTFILLCRGRLGSNSQPTDRNTGLNEAVYLGKVKICLADSQGFWLPWQLFRWESESSFQCLSETTAAMNTPGSLLKEGRGIFTASCPLQFDAWRILHWDHLWPTVTHVYDGYDNIFENFNYISTRYQKKCILCMVYFSWCLRLCFK